MPDWEDRLVSREPSPEERAIANESKGGFALEPVEEEVLRRVWTELRRLKPHLFVVLKAFVEGLSLRDEPSRYSHGSYRGFYAEWSRRLGISENAVKARKESAVRWFARRLRVHLGKGR
jgi:hypothetical protein